MSWEQQGAARLGSCSVFCVYIPRDFPSKVNTGLQMRNLQDKQIKWLVQGQEASWWQGLEEKPVGLTHFPSDIPGVISLLLLSWFILLYSFTSGLFLRSCSNVHGSNAAISGGPITERKMGLFPSFAISFTVDNSCWLFFGFGYGMKMAQFDRQEQWMTSLHSTTNVPLLLFDYRTPSQPCQQAKQHGYSSVRLLLKMQREVVWLGTAGIYTASADPLCFGQRACSAPEHVPSGCPPLHYWKPFGVPICAWP